LRVTGSDGKIAAARVFAAQAPAARDDGPQAAEAVNMAFARIVSEMAPWIADAASKQAASAAAEPPAPDADGAQ
jgi:ABC-type uncharacterized transport system auxiliary subunit